jgi:hypothetical protein
MDKTKTQKSTEKMTLRKGLLVLFRAAWIYPKYLLLYLLLPFSVMSIVMEKYCKQFNNWHERRGKRNYEKMMERGNPHEPLWWGKDEEN